MANTLTNIEPQEVVEMVWCAWWAARRNGVRARPIVGVPDNLWTVRPPDNWMGIRWRFHTGQLLTINIGADARFIWIDSSGNWREWTTDGLSNY